MKGFRMYGLSSRLGSALVVVVVGVLLGGCGSKVINRAPVEDRGTGIGRPAPVAMDPTTPAVKQLPGFENAGKPGYYTVKPGDTLIRIGLDHGQSSKDIARWSALDNPNRIEIGQVLRVMPPTVSASNGVVTKPVTLASATPIATAPASAASADKHASSAPPPSSTPAPAATATAEDEIGWIWPTNGAVLAGFDEVKNKGLDIGGAAGDPVLAAADGRVVDVVADVRGADCREVGLVVAWFASVGPPELAAPELVGPRLAQHAVTVAATAMATVSESSESRVPGEHGVRWRRAVVMRPR